MRRGIDYLRRSGSVTIPASSTSATVNVPVCGDVLDESDHETFNLTLSSPWAATITDGTGVGTITDNDPTPRLTLTNARTLDEGDAAANLLFVAQLSAVSGRPVTFDVGFAPVSGPGATSGTACGPGVD